MMHNVRINPKAAVACVVSLLVCVYLVYSWAAARSSMKSGTIRRQLDTWKQNDFVDIPQPITERAQKIKVEENRVKVVMDKTRGSVHCLGCQILSMKCRQAVSALGEVINDGVIHPEEKEMNIFYQTASGGESKSPMVVLLHGASSSSQVWNDLKTMHLIAAMGHKAIAIDLPGWAKSKDVQLTSSQRDEFLAMLFKALNVERPLLISASMSGSYVLPYMMLPDPSTCDERVSAFVPLAPVSTPKFTHAQYHRCRIPTMIVYGTKDKTLGLESVGNLRNMPNSEIMQMEGAGHANYEERPNEWHRLLYNFLLALEQNRD